MLGPLLVVALALPAAGCERLERFDTKGRAAYCGPIVGSSPVRTPVDEGGFDRIGMKVDIDTDKLSESPALLTTDDAKDGPCRPRPMFDAAPLRVTEEVVEDSLSMLVFDDGQVQNIVGWAESTCRGSMLAVLSLYKDEHVDVRLLRPRGVGACSAAPAEGCGTRLESTCEGGERCCCSERDAFGRFVLQRSEEGCGF
jgi:hypothetical protein